MDDNEIDRTRCLVDAEEDRYCPEGGRHLCDRKCPALGWMERMEDMKDDH